MRLQVIAGRNKLLIPVDSGDRTVAWLATEVGRRLARLKTSTVEPVYTIEKSGPTQNAPPVKTATSVIESTPVSTPIRELRTSSNHHLDMDDQIMDVLSNNDVVLAITGSALSSDVRTGDMVNQYYLLDQIGEGTFGRVFKAKDLNLNRLVAVKVLRKDKSSEISTRRFLREAELNGRLSFSPHIVTVHDFGRTSNGVLFIVMELLKGRPLGDLIDERIESQTPFTVLECIHILSPVLRGLQAAHTHNPPIVHRDLKPDNIWLNEFAISSNAEDDDDKPEATRNKSQQQLAFDSANESREHAEGRRNDDNEGSSDPLDYASKIMDFGIAIPSELWYDTLAAGTRMYSSPEQVRRRYKLDGRSDVYSVGVILYQMLSLLEDVPFDPIDVNLGQIVPPISDYTVTPISEQMAHIVMKALDKEPDGRWRSADEMADMLHREEAALLSSNPPRELQPKKILPAQQSDAQQSRSSDTQQWDPSPPPADVPDKKRKQEQLKQQHSQQHHQKSHQPTSTPSGKPAAQSSAQLPPKRNTTPEPYSAPVFKDQDVDGPHQCKCSDDCKCKCVHCCCNKHRNRERHYQRMLQRRLQSQRFEAQRLQKHSPTPSPDNKSAPPSQTPAQRPMVSIYKTVAISRL